MLKNLLKELKNENSDYEFKKELLLQIILVRIGININF
jgi:hypothetical protein